MAFSIRRHLVTNGVLRSLSDTVPRKPSTNFVRLIVAPAFICIGKKTATAAAPPFYGVLHREGVCVASMKKEEAKRAVLSAYDSWAKKYPNQASMMGGFLFFRYLQKEKSDLLDFRAVDDEKWQIVHGWLQDRLGD